MRVIVCGGRDFVDRRVMARTMEMLHQQVPITLVVHGAARGADRLAGDWAWERDILCHEYPAAWGTHGRGAGPIRNQQMLAEGKAELLIAFPGGAGTADMVQRSKAAGLPVLEVLVDPWAGVLDSWRRACSAT